MQAKSTREFPLESVLLVDDDPDWRSLTREAIHRMHPRCRVSEARDGVEALLRLRAGERTSGAGPSVVCLDLEMPGLSGWDVLSAMRKDRRLCEVPVMLVIGVADEAARRRAHGLGASGLIQKSAGPDEVVRRATDVAAGAGWVADIVSGSCDA